MGLRDLGITVVGLWLKCVCKGRAIMCVYVGYCSRPGLSGNAGFEQFFNCASTTMCAPLMLLVLLIPLL